MFERPWKPMTSQLGLFAAAVSIALMSSAALGQKIGVTTAVTLTTTGQPPGLQKRQLIIGTDMVANEQIVTASNGRAHLLFLDRSSLIVAPNSNLVLDEYVFDPNTNTGKVIFSTTKGFFRYVGGALSKNKNAVEIRTPLATIGLRGGIADLDVVNNNGQTERVTATKLFGTDVTVTPIGGDTTTPSGTEIKRNGFKASIGANGQTVSLAKVTPNDLMQNLKRVESGNDRQLPAQPTQAAGPRPGGERGQAARPGANANANSPTQPNNGTGTAPPGGDGTVAPLQTAVIVPDETSAVPDSGASQPPVAVAPNLPGVNLRFMTAGVIGFGPALGSIDGQTDFTKQTQDGANQQVLGDNLISSILTYSGWFQLDPVQDFGSTVFNFGTAAIGPRIAANNLVFSSGSVTDGFFTATLNGDVFKLPVPIFDKFTVNPALTSTPLGQVSGTGFFAPTKNFIFYNLDLVDTGAFATLFGGSPFTGTFPTNGFAAHTFNVHPLPTEAGGDIIDQGNFTIYSAYGTNISGDIIGNSSPTGPRRSVAGGAVVIFDETGGTQRSAMSGLTGNYIRRFINPTVKNAGPIELAAYGRGFARLTATEHGVRSVVPSSTMLDSAGNSFFGANGPDYFVLNSASTSGFFAAPRIETSVAFDQPLDALGPGFHPFFANGFAQPRPSPPGLGAVRTTRTASLDRLYGYTGGISEVKSNGVFSDYVFNNDPDFSITGSKSSQTTVDLLTNAQTNGAFVVMFTQDVNSTFGNEYRFGGGNGSVRAAFIDDKRIILRDRSVTPGSENNLSVNVGAIGIGVLGAGAVGDPIERGNLLFATSEVVGNVLPNGVTPCTCAFLEWGYWSGDVRAGNAVVATDPFRRENIHLASWVAGVIPDATIVTGLSGTASYSGHIVGAVKNGGSYAIRAAPFTHNYNFASKTGIFTVNGFDGVNYSGPTSSPVQGNDFQAGPITGVGTNRDMQIKGTFFSSPNDIVKYNGGNFSIRNPSNSYKAGGIFAGQR